MLDLGKSGVATHRGSDSKEASDRLALYVDSWDVVVDSIVFADSMHGEID